MCLRSLLYRICFLCVLCASWPAGAGRPAKPPALTLENIFTKKLFSARSFGPARWLARPKGFITLEPSQALKGARDLVLYRLPGLRKEIFVSARRLIPKGKKKPLTVKDFAVSSDGLRVLIFTNSRRVWRLETRGDWWVLDRRTGGLKRLGGSVPPASLMFAEFSPDGRKAAYVHDGNLYVEDLQNGTIRKLTERPSTEIVNGTTDWVYEEEFRLRKAFAWSPDGKAIAYLRIDDSGVGKFTLVDYTDSLYPKLKTFPYPKAGTTNPACTLGVVSVRGGPTCWVPVPGDPRNNYIPRFGWLKRTGELWLLRLNRLQNRLKLMLASAATTGKPPRIKSLKTLFEDRDDAWIDIPPKVWYLEDGSGFLYLSERGGWRQLYLVGHDGSVKLLTPGSFDVIKLEGIDSKRKLIYFAASPYDPKRRYLYKISLKGGRPRRVTPRGLKGFNTYRISPDGAWAFHTVSTFRTPPLTDLISLPGHKRLKILQANTTLRRRLQAIKHIPSEFFRVEISGGVLLDGWWISPPRFDPSRRYPILFYVYGEPAGQTVLDRWGGDTRLWFFMLAQKGYFVASLDNRGTPAPRGRAWRKCIYRQVGILASKDQAEGASALLERWSFLDPERVGIWGWSGGGSMSLNAVFRYPDIYRLAMAIAFVSDQRLYDTIYQERYMGLPEENKEGYRLGSPITFAKNLKGHLLLIHGTADDNCHYQSCERLVNELVAHNKIFSMVSYPGRTHSLREGKNTRRHLFETMTEFLEAHMPPAAR